MKNHIPKIKALHKAIEATLFTIHPVFAYPRLIDAIDLLARLVHDFPGDTEELLYIGEYSSVSVDNLIIAAYWHFSQWHEGQNSPSYRALCNLGKVFQPGCTSEPSRGDSEFECFQALDGLARRNAKLPVYRFYPIEIGV